MIDTKELRKLVHRHAQVALSIPIKPAMLSELLDRLEAAEKAWKISDQTVYDLTEKVIPNIQEKLKAAEKERDKLKELNIALCTKSNSQVIHNARLAEENDALRAKITEMEISKHEVSEAHNVAKRRLSALADENIALQAKIAEMGRQEPVGTAHAMPGASAFTMACFAAQDIPVGAKLYALPGAQTQGE